jgi:hypothetical protein
VPQPNKKIPAAVRRMMPRVLFIVFISQKEICNAGSRLINGSNQGKKTGFFNKSNAFSILIHLSGRGLAEDHAAQLRQRRSGDRAGSLAGSQQTALCRAVGIDRGHRGAPLCNACFIAAQKDEFSWFEGIFFKSG